MINIRGRHSIFLRFMLSYLLILTIPLTIVSLLYHRSLIMAEEDARQANLSVLEQSKDIIDGRLLEMDNITTQLALNSKIRGLLYYRGSIEDHIYQVRDTWRDLSSYTISNQFISMFFIYFRNSDIILSPYTTYIRLPLFYDDTFKYSHYDYELFHGEILNHYYHRQFMPSTPVLMDGKVRNMILSVQSIPYEYPSEYNGNILFFIDEEEIQKLMARQQIENGGWAYIADREGHMITSYCSSGIHVEPIALHPGQDKGFVEHTIAGEKMIISYTASAYNGWTYVAGVPYLTVMERVENIRRLMWLTIGVCLGIGVLIAYFLAYANSKPLKEIIQSLSDFYHKESRNDYDLLRGSVSRLIEDHKAMEEAMQEQLPLIKAGFLDRLFRAEFSNTAEMKAVLSQTGWDMHAKGYAVLIIQINMYHGMVSKEAIHALNMNRLLIGEVLTNLLKEKAFLHHIDVDKVALLLCFDTSNDSINIKTVEELVSQLRAILASESDIQVSVASSTIFDRLPDACYGFDEAKQALSYQLAGDGQSVIWFRNTVVDNSIHYYPIDLEMKLVNLVKAGDKEKTEKIYKGLYVENFMRRNLPPEMVWQLLFEIRGTLIRLIDEVHVEDQEFRHAIKQQILQLYNGRVLEEIFPKILETFMLLCEAVNHRKKSHNVQLKDRIVAFILEHYMDSALSLSMLSSEFDVSEFYLSQFFKEQSGENFGTYLERIRIDQAYELLSKTELSIEEIAAKVGYNSAHAFRRAFKRVHGIVPTACRGTARGRTNENQDEEN